MTSELTTDKAMILARGLGTRMQKRSDGVELDEATAKLAGQGAKGLISIGRPFLDHTLQALMDAGMRDFCLVVAPGPSALRDYYEAVGRKLTQGRISFAVQDEPLGTANAVAAGCDWADGKPFIVLNCDNYYPPSSVRALASAKAPAIAAFERDALTAMSNIPPDRISRFAVIDMDEGGLLRRIVEKPDDPDDFIHDGRLYVSMNCFMFTADIFRACESIEPDPVRGEYELPTAVQYSIERMGLGYRIVECREGVLDMTGRDDIQSVREFLTGHEIHFPSPENQQR